MNDKTRAEVIAVLKKMKREDLVPHVQEILVKSADDTAWRSFTEAIDRIYKNFGVLQGDWRYLHQKMKAANLPGDLIKKVEHFSQKFNPLADEWMDIESAIDKFRSKIG
jgi:hypothetical protein